MPSVLVIGGGPAGASFAARMAQLGADVTLVERVAFPRPRLGESLTPGVRTLLEATGAWPAVAALGFPAARDVRVIWEGPEATRVRTEAGGLIVDRGRFDEALLSHARRQGVRVLQPADVTGRRRRNGRWEVEVRHAGGREVILGNLLADARGRHAQAGRPRCRAGTATLALHAVWRGRNLPRQAMVAAGEKGWFWAVPLPDGRVNAQAFIDPGALDAMPGVTLLQRYRHLMAGSAIAPLLADAEIEGAVAGADATPSRVEDPAEPDLIRLGDAALTIDPISSSGVQKALQTALAGAIVANTLLRRTGSAAHAMDFYRDSLAGAAMRHAAWAGAHYAAAARSRPDAFWSRRARAEEATETPDRPVDFHVPMMLSPQARLADVPCLGDAFVELRRSLVFPGLAEPVAYLGQQPLADLLDIDRPMSLAGLVQSWSRRMPLATAAAIARWLCRHHVLVPVNTLGAAA